MSRRRVVYLGHVARLSGGEIGLLRFLDACDEVDATVILAEDGPLVPRLEAAGARVLVLPMDEGARSLTRAEVGRIATHGRAVVHTAAYVRRIAGVLRRLRPDLVHTNSLKAGVYGTPAARLAGRPTIWHLHDRIAPDYLPPRVVPVLRAMASTTPSALVVPSQMTLNTVGRHFRPGLRTAVIPLPVPRPDADPVIRDEVRTVGIVGRLTPWKGQHVFLDAFARAFGDGDVRGRVIGNAMFGETDYEADLHAQAARLGIADRIDFVGFVADMENELRGLDVVVHASVLADPLTTVVLEGMAAGVPLVATNVGGHAEHITHGVQGLLHTPGDPDSLAAQLRRLAGDADLRRRMSAQARRTSRDFAPDAVVGRMLALYDEVAS